jgi:hypothetical protein
MAHVPACTTLYSLLPPILLLTFIHVIGRRAYNRPWSQTSCRYVGDARIFWYDSDTISHHHGHLKCSEGFPLLATHRGHMRWGASWLTPRNFRQAAPEASPKSEHLDQSLCNCEMCMQSGAWPAKVERHCRNVT